MEEEYDDNLEWLNYVITGVKEAYDLGLVMDENGNARYIGPYNHIIITAAMILGEFLFHDAELIFKLNNLHFGWLADIFKKEEYKNHYYELTYDAKKPYFEFLDDIISNMDFERNYPIEGHIVRDMGFDREYLNLRRHAVGGRRRRVRSRKTRTRRTRKSMKGKSRR